MPGNSPINVKKLSFELQHHPDKNFTKYLIDGFSEGFETGFKHLPALPYECKNLLSAIRQPDITSQLIQSELVKGYLIGPFDIIPYPHYRISQLALLKGSTLGKRG